MNTPEHVISSPVRVQFRYTVEHMSEGLKIHLKYNSGALNLNRRLNKPLGGILVFFGVATLFLGKAALAKVVPILFMILLGLGLIFQNRLFNGLLIRVAKLNFRKNPNKNVVVSWTFSREAISSEGEGFNFTLSWNKVFAFLDSPMGFLMYPQEHHFHWMPFSCFANNSDIDCVRQIARSQAITYKKVS